MQKRESGRPNGAADQPRLAIAYRDPKTLRDYERNARTHSDAQVRQIRASIDEFGFNNPILLKDDGETIGAGHGRCAAALLDPPLAEVPTIVLSGLTERQWRAYAIADNKLALNAGWDEDLLRLEVSELLECDIGADLMGFDDAEIALLLGTSGPDENADEIPCVSPVAVTRPGDLWVLGKHRLKCGDSTSKADVDDLMRGRQADLCFTSPPYGQQRDYGVAREHVRAWDALMAGVFSLLPVKEGGQVLVNLGIVHQDGEWVPYWDEWLTTMRGLGWRRFGWYVWDQGPGLPGDWNGRLAPSHEFIFHFNRQPRRPNKTVRSKMAGAISNGGLRGRDGSIGGRSKGPSAIQGHKIPDSVLRIMRHKGGLGDAGSHPAVFPVELVEAIYGAYAGRGALVVEPFGGAGTQILAAERQGLACFAMELDPAYVDVAVRRWQKATGRAAILETTGEPFSDIADRGH